MSAAAPTTPAATAAAHGLPRLGARPDFTTYLRQVWQRRHFGIQLAQSRFRAETARDRLGIGWIVLRPLINAVVYGTVFMFLLASSTRPENFVAFLVTGIFVFQFFSGSLSDGAKSIVGNLSLVQTLHFPRALLPIATIYQQVLGLVPMVAVLFLLVPATGEPITWRWLQVVPALALMTLFNLGTALITARATIHIRDITQLLPFVTRIMFYVSGVFFSVERVVDEPVLQAVLEANPVNVYMSLSRGALIYDLPAEPFTWALAVAWGVVTLAVGFVFFWLAEERYGRQ